MVKTARMHAAKAKCNRGLHKGTVHLECGGLTPLSGEHQAKE